MIASNAALARRGAVFAVMGLCLIAGTVSYLTLPRESNPDIEIPQVMISTFYEGVAPEDVESLITIPIERELRGLADVEELRSVSAEGSSMITIEFTADVAIDVAVQRVRDKVDQAKSELPTDLADDPQVREVSLADFPVMMVALSGEVDERVLKQIADELEDAIEELAGVLEVVLSGTREREIRVELDPERMAGYRLSLSDLLGLVARENLTTPGGSLDLGDARYLLRVPGEFKGPQVIDQLVLVTRGSQPIYLKDIAQVRDTLADQSSMARLDGRPSVTLAIKKRAGAHAITLADAVRAVIAEARPQLPTGVDLAITLDTSRDIARMVSELENSIATGLFLVVVILLLFLGPRNAIFVALAIPFSMLISFAILQALGITLNMVVLFSLILALGMLVDNAIVVVESAWRHVEEGKTRLAAARAATAEVGWPIISSTLTTLCAFGPMLFWPGMMGEFMRFLPLTLIVVLSASLFVALVINPVLCATFMGRPRARRHAAGPGWIQRGYERLLEWSLSHRGLVLLASFLATFGVILLWAVAGAGVEFMPETEPNRALIAIELPAGTGLATSDALTRKVEAIVAAEPDVRFVTTGVGQPEEGSVGPQAHLAQLNLEFVDREERHESTLRVLERIRTAVLELTGATIRVERERSGPASGSPLEIEIRGAEVDVLQAAVRQAETALRSIPGLVDLENDLARSSPEIRVVVDRERASLLGLSTAQIATTIKAAIGGYRIGSLRDGEDEFDIVARLPEDRRLALSTLEALLIPASNGAPVPLSSVAGFELGTGFGAIRRLDQKRLARVSADCSGRSANEVLADARLAMAALELPKGVTFRFAGEVEDQQEAGDFLVKAFIAAIFLIALVLLTQFNSVGQVLTVLASVLLSLGGVFFGLLVLGMAFGVLMTGIGIVSLAGVVVNNGIVLIDTVNQLRSEGLPARSALVKAGTLRLRPVVMTAVTTILGMLPMAVGVNFDIATLSLQSGGESAQWWSPLAVAVIFGLAVATLLTLVVVPVLCSMTGTGDQQD